MTRVAAYAVSKQQAAIICAREALTYLDKGDRHRLRSFVVRLSDELWEVHRAANRIGDELARVQRELEQAQRELEQLRLERR